MKINDSNYLMEWKNDMVNVMKRLNPNWDEEDISKEINKMVKDSFSNPKVTLDNNYTHERKDASLISVFDWIGERKPLIAGNGTFYKNQHEAKNPTARMLKEMQLTRKSIKKEMFALDPSTYEYEDKDRGQNNEKINMNSYYGASGMKSSAFFSQWSGPATTLTAQSVISTTLMTFESSFGDNLFFIDLNEFFFFIDVVFREEIQLDDWVRRISKEEVSTRIKSRFMDYKPEYDEIIDRFVNGLTSEERTIIYYKNNMMDFIDHHSYIKSIYQSFFKKIPFQHKQKELPSSAVGKFDDVDAYNSYMDKEQFFDPNDLPSTIKDDVVILKDLIMKYVYVPYLAFDRIHRLKSMVRKTVVVVDTDSNMLNLGPWVDYTFENIIDDKCVNRDEMNNVFIAINTMAYILTAIVTDILDVYGIASNIPDDYRKEFSMKNEFLFVKLIVSKKKKRYLASIILREGRMMSPMKTEIKGHDFKKSSASKNVSDYYKKISVKRLLGDEVDPSGLISDVRKLKGMIEEDLRNGGKEYLPLASIKEPGAYKDPYKIQSFKAVYAWNSLYPDDMIEPPNKVSLLKLNIFTPNDIKDLQYKNKVIYDRIMKYIFGSSVKAIASKGLQVIAIPGNRDIPEWLREYIDYPTVKNNIVTQFGSVLSTIQVDPQSVGKTNSKNGKNRKTKEYSNIIRV